MTRAYPVPSASATALGGAVGGSLGAVAALAALMIGAHLTNRALLTALNAVGAFTVRWLQFAKPDAVERFYWDATLGGVACLWLVGALGGALFALVLARLPEDHPIAWGAILGVSAWAGLRWLVAPALDPLLLLTFDWRVLLPACLAYALVVGYWVHLSRDVALRLTRMVGGA